MLVLWSCTPARCMYVAWDVRKRPCLTINHKCFSVSNFCWSSTARRVRYNYFKARQGLSQLNHKPCLALPCLALPVPCLALPCLALPCPCLSVIKVKSNFWTGSRNETCQNTLVAALLPRTLHEGNHISVLAVVGWRSSCSTRRRQALCRTHGACVALRP